MAKDKSFYEVLAQRESSNDPEAQNNLGYIGLYQMGEATLVDVGYYTKPPKEGQEDGKQYNNDWTGTWTGKSGINSIKDFKSHPEIQDHSQRIPSISL